MFDAFKAIPTAPAVKVAYPIGCLRDIPSGQFVQTPRGNWVMMGGYQPINSTTGPGNSFKTDEILYGPLTILGHLKCARAFVYDTENSLTYDRFKSRQTNFYGLEDFEFVNEQYQEKPRFLLHQRKDIEGDAWFEAIKGLGRSRTGNKDDMMTLPILDPVGKEIKVPTPFNVVVDSLSAMSSDNIQEKIVDKNAVGDSGANTIFMRDGAMKTQLIIQLPNVAGRYGMTFGMTAHIGNHIQMDPYAPQPMRLTFSRNGTQQKGVPQKFQFINDFVGEIYSAKPLLTDKAPKFPLMAVDREKGNDLFQLTEVSSRNKSGPSGVARGIIVSQRDGIQPALTEFDYIKETCSKNGISGNNTTFHMDLYPDTNIQRTTVRAKILDDFRLATAVRLTAELNQIRLLWKGTEELMCTPKELHDDIKAMGYDWDVLLNTRYWWVPKEEEKIQKLNELTIYDLLHMRKGNYHPYWLEDDKKTIKKAWLPVAA